MPAKTSSTTTWYRLPPPPPSPRLPHASRTNPTSTSNPPSSPHLPRTSKSSTVNPPASPLAAKNPPSSTTTTPVSKPPGSLHSTKASCNPNPSKATSVTPISSKPAPANPPPPPRPASVNPNTSKATSGNPLPSKTTSVAPLPQKTTSANPLPSRPSSVNPPSSKPSSANPPASRPTSLNPAPSPRLSRRLVSPTQNAPPSRHLPQMPGVLASPGARTPVFPSTISPSKLPTSMPNQTSSSPKRSSGSCGIASPTRVKNADRLPAVTRTPTSPVAEQGLKLISEEPKPKLKDGKPSRTNEKNKSEERKKDKASSDKVRRGEGTKKQVEARGEAKIIPKRKKSERSNSDVDIKPKKMVIKERHPSPTRLEEEILPSARLPKPGPPDRGLKPGKGLRRPTTLKLPAHNRPLLSCKELQVRNVEERMREMDIGKEGDCEEKVDGNDENEAEMVTPVAEMDVVDSHKVDLFPCPLDLPTHDTGKVNSNKPDCEECEDLAEDDIEPLSSEMGTYSLEFISDTEVRGSYQYTNLACMPEFGSTEMVSSGVLEDSGDPEACLDDGKMQEGDEACTVQGGSGDRIEREDYTDDGKMQEVDDTCIIPRGSDDRMVLHIDESACHGDAVSEAVDNHDNSCTNLCCPDEKKRNTCSNHVDSYNLNHCGESYSVDHCYHAANSSLAHYNRESKTSSTNHGDNNTTDLPMSCERARQDSLLEDSTMQDITSLAGDEEEEEKENKDEPLTFVEEIPIDDEKPPSDERNQRNDDLNLQTGDRNLQNGDRILPNGDRILRNEDLKLQSDPKTLIEDGPNEDHSSFPSEMMKDQLEEMRGRDGWIQHSDSRPKSPVTRKTQESRRKARCGEIKRDVTPRAKVGENARLVNSITARVVEAKKVKKKSKDEEMAKVSERRSKRKIETERTRGGTKKSARLFVEKDVDKTTAPPPPLPAPRSASPCPSDVSTSSGQSQASSMSRVSSRLPIRALHVPGPTRSGSFASLCSTASGGGGSRGSRDSRVTPSRQNATTVEKKRVEGVVPPPRRPRLDNIKSTIPKPGRLPPRNTDPVKAARAGGGSGPRGPLVGHNGPAQQQAHQQAGEEQVRRLEAQVEARAAEARAATKQREEAARGIQALTVLIHHLTTTYDPFSTPRLKAEVVRLSTQLTEARLNLDESSAALRRAEEASASREQQHQEEIKKLQQEHQEALDLLTQQHKQQIDLALEKHRKELSKFAEDQQTQREEVSRAHSAEMEQLEGEWRNKLDLQHEKHMCALQDLNTQHTHKLRELELSRQARERELEEANCRLQQDQEALRVESRKLQETLLNDTDHRLLAVRKMCTSLKSEVDSLKTVVDMKNTEIHELRGRVVETERLGGELEAARERVRALQAKTEDLQAQMEKRVQQERHLVNEHRQLLETYQRESNANKRLSLENEELAWKLRQREEIMSTSMPSSTLDLVSRAGPPRHQEGAVSPQAAPRSPRVAVRSPSGKISPSKCEAKRRSRLGLSPEANVEGDERLEEVSFESPPPSPCVKAVVEKSNSVSFILDLNDSQSDDSFLDLPPSPRPRPQRTASLSAADRPRTPTHIRRVIHNNRANSLNRNCVLGDAKPKDMSRKPKEMNGKGKDLHEKPKEFSGKTLEVNGRPGSRRTTSESSDAGSEVERISPTGLAWTVPVHQPKSPVKVGPHNGSPVRKRMEHHLLEDPDEDEYEETPSGTHQFIEVGGLTSSSEAASDSELSQCDIKEGSLTDSDSDSCDSERHTQKGNLGHKSGPWCPKEGAGEAMITDELLKQYASEQISVDGLPLAKRNGRRRLPSAPSSDSDGNVTPHNEGNNDVSWSEDVDITSSSEIHEL